MKIMQLDNKNISDLEYLANLGFEKSAWNDSDINELKAKVRSRSLSYNSGSYFAFISLISGIFLGLSVFFRFYTPPLSHIPVPKLALKNKSNDRSVKPATVILDTVNIIKDNFVRENAIKNKIPDTLNTLAKVAEIDTISNMASLPIELSSLKPEKIKEPEIRYIPNSPIIFIHDLKITDYSSLYFRQNKFIVLNSKEGINASYANKEDYKKYGNVLEPSRNYYLHEALADAMLQFKNKNYNACISGLNYVAQFTGNDINCRFYYGMCYFYKKNYSAALKNLEDCISNSNNAFLQEAEYYKALCLVELGNKTEASILFKKISDDGGFYAEKAKKYL